MTSENYRRGLQKLGLPPAAEVTICGAMQDQMDCREPANAATAWRILVAYHAMFHGTPMGFLWPSAVLSEVLYEAVALKGEGAR